MVESNNAIARYANRRDYRRALEIFQRLQRARAENSYSYSNMINAYVQCGEVEEAVELLHQLRKHPKLKLDIVSCTAVLKGYSKVGDVSRAVALLKMMKDAKPQVVPNVRTLNTFLRGCIVAGAVEEAEHQFAEITKTFKVSPDVSSWEYLIILLGHSLQIEKIQPILGRIKDDVSNLSGMGLMFICLCKALAILGDFKKCKKNLAQARHYVDAYDAMDLNSVSLDVPEGVVTGGKRAWRQNENGSREASLQVDFSLMLMYP